MSLRIGADLYRKFCVVAAVAFFMTNFSWFTEKWGFIPLYWVELLGALTAPLVIGAVLTARWPIRPLMIWCAGFLLISIIWYFPSRQDPIAYQEVQTRVLSVIFVLLMLFLCSRPADQHLARVMVAWSTVFTVGLCIYELFNPLTFSKIPGRSSALFENSNQTGAALMLGMIVGYAVVPPRLRSLFVVVAGVGILTTFTRSAMLGWILVVMFLIVRGFGFATIRNALIFAAVFIGFIFSPYWSHLESTLQERGTLNLDVVSRLNFFNGGSADDQSASDRKGVVEEGIRMFEAEPYFGHGTGASRTIPGFDLSTHNIYVSMLIDHGILGFFIVPGLLLATLWGANGKTFDVTGPFVLFIFMWGFFSHNVLEERYILLPVGLIAAMVASNRTRKVEAPATQWVAMPSGAVAHA